jgi:hypothetical protein
MWIAAFSIAGLVIGWTVCALLITSKKADLEMEMFDLKRKQEEVLVDLDKLSTDLDTLKAVVEGKTEPIEY